MHHRNAMVWLAWVCLAGAVARGQAEDPNWLSNPGFEEAAGGNPAGWDLGMEGRGEGEAVWQQGQAHAGERCLRVRLTTQGDYYLGRQRLSQAVQPGQMHQIRGWYRSDAEVVAHPCVYHVAADGRVISAWETALPRAPEWTPFHFTWTPPADTVRFEVQLRAQSVPGTAWFDEVMVGSAARLEAERRERLARAAERVAGGPFAVRALEPSERPTLADIGDATRWAVLEQATRVELFAARAERESFGALVLGLDGQPLTARVTDLAGPGAARLEATAAKVRWAGGVVVDGQTWPDPLFEQQPFTAQPDCLPIVWVTVAVPADGVAAGDYNGTLEVESAGRRATLPIRLQVYDFALPTTSFLPTSFWLFRHTLRNAYGLKEVPTDLYRRYLDLCLESRLAPIDAAEWHDQPLVRMLRDAQGELQVDWQTWDAYLAYCLDRGMSAFNVADDHWFGSYFRSFVVRDLATGKEDAVKLAPASDDYARTVVRFFRLAREHFTAKGWAAKAYLQAYDEPAGNDEKLLAEIRHFYELARQGWPGLRTLITAPPQSHVALQGSIGIWCPLTPHYDGAVADARRELGEEVWWYVCCAPRPPWANFFLDQPGAAHRVLFWQTFQQRADGLLYWGVNHWPGLDARAMDPLPADRRWPAVPWNDGGRKGDGYFLYPGPDGPLTGLRFEIMRDGVEDYDALRLLQDLVKTKGDRAPADLRERARQALVISPEISTALTNYPATAQAMVARRRLVNELIVQFSRLP
jgi:hypothetical protein